MAKRIRRRRSGPARGAAAVAKRASARCKQALSSCMTGKKSRQAKGHCLVTFNRCARSR